MDVEFIIGGLIGGAGAMALTTGLASWLGKVWANRILEQDRVRYQTQMEALLDELRTRSSKQLFVHRLQFEKEFEVYLDLWKEALALGKALSHFRQLSYSSGKTQAEEIDDLAKAYNKLKERVYDHRPFYAPRVYDITKEFLDVTGKVFRRVRDPRMAEKGQEQVEELFDQINSMVPLISEAIRERVFFIPATAKEDRASAKGGSEDASE